MPREGAGGGVSFIEQIVTKTRHFLSLINPQREGFVAAKQAKRAVARQNIFETSRVCDVAGSISKGS